MIAPFDHPWLSGLFGDAEAAAPWGAGAQLGHMLAFEAAWSRHGHLAGLWPEADGRRAASAIAAARVAPEELREGTAQDGVCVPALVRLLKERTGEAAIHTGATSQDVIDTATVLSLVASLDLAAARLEALEGDLAALEARFGDRPLMGRTRMQAAVPVTVAERLRGWRLPLADHRERLRQLRPRAAVVQIGGAAGDRAALGPATAAFCAAVAADLGLAPTPHPWHVRRDGIAEAGSVLSLVSGTLGKIGQDICLMAQQGIGTVTLSGGGGSSAMPHKRNPVAAELLVTLARFNAVQVSALHQAMVHEQERSGSAWALEWMVLPQVAVATGRALGAARALVASVAALGDP